MAFTKYPITDYNNLNVDWMVEQIRENTDNIDLNSAGLTAETSARESADTAEQAARIAADAELQRQIDLLDPVGLLDSVSTNKRSLPGVILFLGDSYLAGWTPDGDVTDWGTLLAAKLNKTIGLDAFRFVLGGAGFVNAIGGRTFVSLLQEAHGSGSFDPADVKYIITGGGWNDRGADPALLRSAVETFHNTAASLFPNAISYVANMGYGHDYSNYQKRKISLYYNFYNGLGDIFTVLLVNHQLGAVLASDNVHPTAQGQELLAKAIYQKLFTGDYYGDSYGPEALQSPNNMVLNAIVANHTLTLSLYNNGSAQFVPVSVSSGTANGNFAAFELSSSIFWSGADYWIGSFPCWFTDTSSGSSVYRGGFMKVRLHENKVQLFPVLINAAGNNWVNMNKITQAITAGFTFSIPIAAV